MNSNKQIVCISTHYWDDSWFRKQQFMDRFVKKGFEVAYVEPSFSLAKKPDPDKIAYQKNRLFSVSVEKRSDRLFIIKPPQAIPFSSRAKASRINYIYFAFRLKKTLKKIGFANYVLWIYPPQYASGINLFDYRKLVFDITDDMAAYKQDDIDKFNYMKGCVELIVRRSDLVITTASTLFRMYENMSRNICLVPNGYDSRSFSGNTIEEPEDVKKLSRPVVGFIGTLFSFLDYELIEYIIRDNPDVSFVFIGALENTIQDKWNMIRNKYTNVFWLGKQKKEDIPAYLSSFDVCINPFKVDDVSRSVSPLKVFEYLAMKKPVVSVKMESLEEEAVAPFIYFANTVEEFNEKLKVALKECKSFGDTLDYGLVEEYSWEKLFKKVFAAVADLDKIT